MPCRCEDDGIDDEGYWDSYIKVLMKELVSEIQNTVPRGWDKEYVHYKWIEVFSHLLKGCPEKKVNNHDNDPPKDKETSELA